jgi:transcriptional regulator with XRE-family HTH domain
MSSTSNQYEVGARLAALRATRGISRDALAARSGTTAGAIYKIEKGEVHEPRRTTLLALCGGLGVALDELTGDPADAIWGRS